MQLLLIPDMGICIRTSILWPDHGHSPTSCHCGRQALPIPQVGKLLPDAKDARCPWTSHKLVRAQKDGIQVVIVTHTVALHLHALVGTCSSIIKAHITTILVHQVGNLAHWCNQACHIGACCEGANDVLVLVLVVSKHLLQEIQVHRSCFIIWRNGLHICNGLPPHQLIGVVLSMGDQDQWLAITSQSCLQVELPPVHEGAHLSWNMNTKQGNHLGNGCSGSTACE